MAGDLTHAKFLEDVKEHALTVLRDDGVYRHVRLAAPGTRAMGFDLLTWPGHLAYTGDMGSFMFSRLQDMFEFFRGHKANHQYWAEKCLAGDKPDGIEEFSEQRFRDAVESDLTDFLASHEDVDAAALRQAVKDELLSDVNEWDSIRRTMEFSEQGFELHDFYEHRLKDYTLRFQWCCHALPWAIGRYDTHVGETVPAPTRTPQLAIDVLNRAVAEDRGAVSTLLNQRVPCNDALTNDATIQCGENTVGRLGIINGIFGVRTNGRGHIAAIIDDNGEVERFQLDQVRP